MIIWIFQIKVLPLQYKIKTENKMRTIATEYRGYGEGSYTIKLVTNNKEKI